MKTLVALLILISISSAAMAQEKTFSLFAGYGGTDFQIDEKKSSGLIGVVFNETVSGTGFSGGFGVGLSKFVHLDFSFSNFKGVGDTESVNRTSYSYELRGFQVYAVVNYLMRSPEKRFNAGIGLGAQYIDGHLDYYEASSQGTIRRQREISQPNFLFGGTCKWRVVNHLHAGFNLYIQPVGKYSGNYSFHLRYTF